MDWQSDVSVGEWLHERLDETFSTMHSVIPRGFAAYVRVPDDADGNTPTAVIVRALIGDTATPGHVALWEGYPYLLGGYGLPGGAPFSLSEMTDADTDADIAWRHQQMLNASLHDSFNNVFLKPAWQDGILSKEISDGPRLHLPERSHVLFAGDLAALSDDRVHALPWHTDAGHSQPPALIWPDSRAWVVVADIDMVSTVVACSTSDAERLLAAGLEATVLAADDDFWAHGDGVVS